MSYDYSKTVEPLVTWYKDNARILAWRENPQPYFVWISEIMLQQTRVEAVKTYFDRFTTALPTIEDLALAKEEDLLKLWEGLGYYNRVRNLQKAAKQVMEHFNGILPDDYETLMTLAGIGSYTAGAIASIAYCKKAPAVDGNVLRVMKRIAGSFDDITKLSVKKALEKDILSILPEHNPGDYNQALMELGATVCLPNGKPLCDKCPILSLCNAKKEHTELLIPVKPPKKARKMEEKTILLFEYHQRFALQKRPAKGLLAGLFGLPSLEKKLSRNELELKLQHLGFEQFTVTALGDAKHIFSHVEWHMTGYWIALKNNPKLQEKGFENLTWASKKEMESTYAIPSAFSYYL